MTDPIPFTLAVLLILGAPGPTNTLLATSSAAVGPRRSLPLIPAAAAGYLIAIATLGLVAGPALAGAPAVATALRLLVGAYLVWLALRLWRQGAAAVGTAPIITPRQLFLTTLLNPKTLVLALGVVPFEEARWWLYLLGFTLPLAASCLGWIAAGALLGRAAAAAGRVRLVPRLGAAAVGAFALLLLVQPMMR